MNHQDQYNFFLVLLCLMTSSVTAQSISQEVIGSSGGFSINQQVGNLHWTAGESRVYIIGDQTEFYLTEGFHQLYHDLLITDIEIIPENAEVFQLYPNPTTATVFLQFTEDNARNIAISNQLGQVLFQIDHYHKGDAIDLSTLPNGIYFLSISYQQAIVKTFKVVKT